MDLVQFRVVGWQTRRLEKVYPFEYMDARMIPVKGEKKSGKCAVYTMIGVNVEIYGAVSKEVAESALSKLNEKWKDRYLSSVRIWNEGFCYVERLFAYPFEIRKMIYTTNTIESFNSALRNVTNRKVAFPNAATVMKALYLRTLDVAAKRVMPYPNRGIIRGKMDLLWGSE